MDELITLLKSSECHFTWKLDEFSNELDTFMCVQDKAVVKNEEVSGQPWRHIILNSVICYEESKNSPTLSDQKIQECMMSIASDEDPFVKKHRIAFEHILYAFKAHVALINSTVSKARELAEKALPFSEMSPEQKAGVMGFKASVMMEYGKEGTRKSLEFAREAVKHDPKEGEWHFLVGKLLQRIRNFSLLKEPSEEEKACFETAFELSKESHCAIFLATCLANVGKQIFYSIPLRHGIRSLRPKKAEEMKAIHERCVTLLNLAAKGNPDCPHNLIRVARGFFNLPGDYKNLAYARKLADACREKAPDNAMVMVVSAQICTSMGETENALKYAKKAGDLGAYGGYIRFFDLQVDFKKQFDEEESYKTILSLFKTPLDVGKTYLHAASYYLFVKKEHFTSFEYFKKALQVDYDLHDIIKSMYVRWIRDNVNMYDIMYNEAKLKVASLKEVAGGDVEKLKTPRYLLFKIAMISPTSSEKKCDRNLVKRLIDNACMGAYRKARNRGRGRGGSRGNGRGGQQNRGRGTGRNYVSVSLSANRSRGRSRSTSSERSVRVKCRGDKQFREINVDWKGSSDSLCSNSSRRSNSREYVRRELKRSLEISARIRQSSECSEKSLKPDSDTDERMSNGSGNRNWSSGCGGWLKSPAGSQDDLNTAGQRPASKSNESMGKWNNSGRNRQDSFKKSTESLDNWRHSGGRNRRDSFKSNESLNNRKSSSQGPSNSWRGTSNQGEPLKTAGSRQISSPLSNKPADLNNSQLKSTFDELVKFSSNPRNIRRADLEAMVKNKTKGADTSVSTSTKLAEQSVISNQSSLKVKPGSTQQSSSTEPEHVARLRETLLKNLTPQNVQESSPPPVKTKGENDQSKLLEDVSLNLKRLDLSNSSGVETANTPAGANDILTSFIRRKIAGEKIGDDSSSDESVDSDYDARF